MNICASWVCKLFLCFTSHISLQITQMPAWQRSPSQDLKVDEIKPSIRPICAPEVMESPVTSNLISCKVEPAIRVVKPECCEAKDTPAVH